MNRFVLASAVALLAGCGSGGEYDGVRDETTVKADVIDRKDKGEETRLTVSLYGKGDHPKSWRASLILHVERNKEFGLPVTDDDKFKFVQEKLDLFAEFNVTTYSETSLQKNSGAQTVFVDMGLDELILYTDITRHFKAGKVDVTMTKDEVDKLRALIVKARQITNAG